MLVQRPTILDLALESRRAKHALPLHVGTNLGQTIRAQRFLEPSAIKGKKVSRQKGVRDNLNLSADDLPVAR
jgi:hypothetical protein